MSLRGIVEVLKDSQEMQQLMAEFNNGLPKQHLTGCIGPEKAAYVAALFQRQGGESLLVITSGQIQAERLVEDLNSFLRGDYVHYFPALEILPHEEIGDDYDVVVQRLNVLERLARGKPTLVVTTPPALSRRLVPVDDLRRSLIHLQVGEIVALDEIMDRLVGLGYRRVPMIEGRGQFSQRGDIIDIFPSAREEPIRMELFGDEIDALRSFDIVSQRSVQSFDQVWIGPAHEYLLAEEKREAVGERILAAAQAQIERLTGLGRTNQARSLEVRAREHAEKLANGVEFHGVRQYLPYFYPQLNHLLDYFPRGIIAIDDPVRIAAQMKQWTVEHGELVSSLLERGAVLPDFVENFIPWQDIAASMEGRKVLFITGLPRRIGKVETGKPINIGAKGAETFHGRIDLLVEGLQNWRRADYRVVMAVSTPERAQRLAQGLKREGVGTSYLLDVVDLQPGQLVITPAALSGGFQLSGHKLILLTDGEIFGRTKRKGRPRLQEKTEDSARRAALAHYSELQPGDYVVHENHGIGRYLGVETLDIRGVHKDYLVVKYAGEDKLYVPTDQIHLLQKYVGGEEAAPRLNKLGGSEWARVKKRVKESVQEMAKELLELYAERQRLEGHAFSSDTPWQEEFEDAFIYEETPDQRRSVEEVKRDMESPRPMDRLLCGDVGYGKTEVAMRAAFKAVMDGKQVAVLVPTTILAQQHERTFRERFDGYPIRIDVLSRFQSAAEQKETIKGLADGTVDIVIGTHRLLSSSIEFKSLGLMIIDEEQRFGVAQKERLKAVRKNIDVLTLTATPIPRTLHMSLTGARDMSIIETPPEGRYPVRTYVAEFNDELVEEAIRRELDRGGQIYFVYNRVQSIEKMKKYLEELVPEARVVIGHGQMNERQLERVMLDFLQGQYDILLCTTIIETGMDIGNVNTLIVCDADRMGLAQLYQLRGRVGRSNKVAYAYFTYNRDKILTEDAEKRLQAIREFSELGSGFKLAMRDLEIRGAGNILGPEQHGFIASVGFDLYCRLLEESVRELKGEVPQELPEPSIDLDVDAYLPDDYINDPQQKVALYKKVVAVRELSQADELGEEIIDRFGTPPAPVENLLFVARLKILAKELGIASLSREKDQVIAKFLTGMDLPWDLMTVLTRKYRGQIMVQQGRNPQIKLRVKGLDDRQLLQQLNAVLTDLHGAWQEVPV
ncbi:MAG: transcription-repair coupling factor [Limnochordia bacterium]